MKYANLFSRLLANSVESETYSYGGTPCWEWTSYLQCRGYGALSLRVPGVKNPRRHLAHRVMAQLAVDRPLDPVIETIEHLCSIPWCINYMHFAIATRSDNTADARARQLGRTRKVFAPLIDTNLYDVDRFIRSLPVLKSTLTDECPF